MTLKTAKIRKLAVAIMLIASVLMAYGIFYSAATVAAQTQETQPAEQTGETQQTEQTQETQPAETPVIIDTLTAEAGTLSAILFWEADSEEIKGYTVEYGLLSGGAYDQICTTSECVDTDPGAVIRDLEQDASYMFRITPLTSAGAGQPSNEAYLTVTGPCSNMGNTELCGRQVISKPMLRFTSIPTSFDFTTLYFPEVIPETEATPEIEATPETALTPVTGETQDTAETPEELSAADYGKAAVLDNTLPGPGTFPPIDVSSSAQDVYNNANPATQPALEDLLGIQDTRNSGGFEAQVQTSGNFTDGVHNIPLTGLYVATNVASPVYSVPATDPAYSCPATDCGVIYGTSVTERSILAPSDTLGNGLGYTWTYTSDFGSGPIVLMDGGLPSTSGRDGYMYQFINFHLNVPAYQPAGDYAVILTYTLIDDTW